MIVGSSNGPTTNLPHCVATSRVEAVIEKMTQDVKRPHSRLRAPSCAMTPASEESKESPQNLVLVRPVPNARHIVGGQALSDDKPKEIQKASYHGNTE